MRSKPAARIERDGGVEGRWRRHDAMRRRVEAWAPETGIGVLPREGAAVDRLALKIPDGSTPRNVVGRVEAAGLDDRGRFTGP